VWLAFTFSYTLTFTFTLTPILSHTHKLIFTPESDHQPWP